jgi:plasmid maintenance system antidote protein VapI
MAVTSTAMTSEGVRRPCTPAPLRLGKLFGDGPAVWARLQTEHDLWEAARRVDVTAMPTIRAA